MSTPTSMRALLLLCGLTTGCAQTANVRCWQPADIAAGDLRSLAVVGATDDVDQVAALALEKELERVSSFELVAHRDETSRIILAGYLDDDGPGLDGLLQYGRQADVDAVVIVDVLKSDVAEGPRNAWTWRPLWRETDRAQTAEVQVRFELIDTMTSEVLAGREMTRKVAAGGGVPDDELLDRLLSECVNEFVTELGPRETESTIELAEGPWYSLSGSVVRRGVHFARRGRWRQAEEAWNKALAHNASDDAALFNLAVASAHAGDYEAAEDYAMEALRIRHTECYAAGLAEIRELRSDREAAEDQFRTAVVPAGFMDRSSALIQ